MKENDFIDLLRQKFPDADLGDDCAVVRPPGGDMLLASDAVVEGVHFRRDLSTPGQAVQKAVTSNVSDIWSMGGDPLFIVFTAGIPDGATRGECSDVVDGLARALGHYRVVLAGGDTVLSPGGWFFDLSITGRVTPGEALRRSGARPGDLIALSGRCGGSLAGLEVLKASRGSKEKRNGFIFESESGRRLLADIGRIAARFDISTTKQDIEGICSERGLGHGAAGILDMVRHHIVPKASRLAGGIGTEAVTAMIDVSDGIARDLSTLCAASGTGAVIDLAGLPVHEGFRDLESTGILFRPGEIEEAVLSSGEEYIMLFTARPEYSWRLEGKAFVVGEMKDASKGITARGRDGEETRLPGRGYEHGF